VAEAILLTLKHLWTVLFVGQKVSSKQTRRIDFNLLHLTEYILGFTMQPFTAVYE
jgi:hypothetical protein